MKNIIIVGPSRSGKPSLAKRLNEKLGYYVISIDKLVAVFQNAYPELDIRLNWNRDKVTENIAPFLAHYLGTFASADGKGLLEYSHGAIQDNKFVLEGAYFDFEKIEDNEIKIDLHVIIAFSVNVKACSDNVIENVKYKVEELTDLKVKEINIFVEGVRVID